jgi:hypothetical protein
MGGPIANPLLENDPLLVLLTRGLHLSPLGFALAGFLSLPLVLFLCCWFSGTLRSNGKITVAGHGLFSWINAYLLLLPVLDYAIFSYYKVYAKKIPELVEAKILDAPTNKVFWFFTTESARWMSITTIAICVGVAMIAVVWPRLSKSRRTTWLSNEGRPRLLSYYFYVVLFGLHGSIAVNWLLRHVAIWQALNRALNKHLVVYSPDKMFGLGALGDLIWNSYAVMLIVTIIIAVWLVGAKLTNPKEPIQKHPGEMAAVIFLLILGPLGVLAPLLGSHFLMSATKEQAEAELVNRIAAVSEEVRSIQSGTSVGGSELSSRVAVLTAQSQLYKFVDDCSTWPVSSEMVSALLAFLNPVVLLLLKKFIPEVPEV